PDGRGRGIPASNAQFRRWRQIPSVCPPSAENASKWGAARPWGLSQIAFPLAQSSPLDRPNKHGGGRHRRASIARGADMIPRAADIRVCRTCSAQFPRTRFFVFMASLAYRNPNAETDACCVPLALPVPPSATLRNLLFDHLLSLTIDPVTSAHAFFVFCLA